MDTKPTSFVPTSEPFEVADVGKLYLFENDFISRRITSGTAWEPQVADVIHKFVDRNSVCLEGGGHIGTHSILLSKLSKELIVFEPIETYADLLLKNLMINECSNFVLHRKALSSKCSDKGGVLGVEHGNSGGTTLLEDSGSDEIKIEFTTIDSLRLEKLDFVKLDIEGFEAKAIEGGLSTIERLRPVIIAESWDSYPQSSLEGAIEKFQFLLNRGYGIERVGHSEYLFKPV